MTALPASFILSLSLSLASAGARAIADEPARIRLTDVGAIVGARAPDSVRKDALIAHFPAKVEIQKGDTCHIYSATSLLQAFCKKELGIEVDISEQYRVYRHLNAKLRDRSGQFLENPLEGICQGGCGKLDRGHALDTLIFYKAGFVCTQAEFRPSGSAEDFVRLARELAESTRAESAKDPSCRGGFPRRLTGELDRAAREACDPARGPAVVQSGSGLNLATLDPGLRRCLAILDDPVPVEHPTPARIQELIDAGHPMVCRMSAPGVKYELTHAGLSEEARLKQEATLSHETVVYGYQRGSKGIEFLTRDSLYARVPAYATTGCDSIVYLRRKPGT